MNVYQNYFKHIKLSFAVFTLLIFVPGCGGSGGGSGSGSGSGGGANGGSSGPPDNTAPTVTAMTPGEATTGMATNARLTVTFSEAVVSGGISPEAVNTVTFRLTDGANSIPGTVGFDTTNNIAVFTPGSNLAPNVTYIATIVTGIKDLGNNSISTDFAWDFVTGGADNIAPTVISTIPVNAATGVAINRKLTASFKEAMDSSTMTPANFTVTGPNVTPVSGTVTYLGGTAIFTPAQNFAPNAVYTARITTSAVDLAGNASQANTWSFTTGANADVVTPVANSTSPAPAESNVAIDRAINVTFSEPMDPVTITTANFTVTGPGTDLVIGTVAYDTSNNTATFTRHVHLATPVGPHPVPVRNLAPNTTYTATLTTGAKDMAGNALANNLQWSFTTAP
ncbi:MAG: Ig-like domain-containing protein [Sulfuricaulis sp.]|uniref:Ig-like domain-containing protein n=1 Tax=Sulfuricaulis sp. TaxID=2003553 RepID=UPI0025FF869A|nr:Ig-like domain-containing protein [Sulfuricaulis sp.]MCR4346439.1 Ig-like domain-containing protein [Sulfuricaulis sp.]